MGNQPGAIQTGIASLFPAFEKESAKIMLHTDKTFTRFTAEVHFRDYRPVTSATYRARIRQLKGCFGPTADIHFFVIDEHDGVSGYLLEVIPGSYREIEEALRWVKYLGLQLEDINPCYRTLSPRLPVSEHIYYWENGSRLPLRLKWSYTTSGLLLPVHRFIEPLRLSTQHIASRQVL